MKKTYNTPEINVTAFNSEDIITLSSDGGQQSGASITSIKMEAIDF